jgi:hypothetical protein
VVVVCRAAPGARRRDARLAPEPTSRSRRYNVFHTYLLPSVVVVVGVVTGSEATSAVRIVWFAHIGRERVS